MLKSFLLKGILGVIFTMSAVMGFAAEKEYNGKIGLSVFTMTNPFFKEIANKITEAAGKNGYKVITVSAEMDPAKQNDQVNDFIARQVDAIILNPADSKAVGETIKHANKAGIPVFTCDIACIAKDVDIVSHVATDNYEGGCMAAVAMMEALNNKGNVAIIDDPVSEASIMRRDGFLATLKKAKSPIKVLTTLRGYGSKAKSFEVMQDILQAHPNINGVFAINDPTALGVFAALEKAGKKDVTIIGFDASPEGKQAVKDGKIYATIKQSTDKIGEGVVNMVVKYSEGEEVPKKYLIPTSVYKKADADKDNSVK